MIYHSQIGAVIFNILLNCLWLICMKLLTHRQTSPKALSFHWWDQVFTAAVHFCEIVHRTSRTPQISFCFCKLQPHLSVVLSLIRGFHIERLEDVLDLLLNHKSVCLSHTNGLVRLQCLFLSCCATEVEALVKAMGESSWVWTSISAWGTSRGNNQRQKLQRWESRQGQKTPGRSLVV